MILELTRGKRPWLRVILLLVFVQNACQPEVEEQQIEIETGSIDDVGPTFSITQEEIYHLGKDGVMQHGFVWSESPNPTIETGNKNELGVVSAIGVYSSTNSGLSPNTTYFVKANGTGVDQISYRTEKSFTTTLPDVPYLHTYTAFVIEEYSAVAGGQIIHNGGAEISSRGVCWSVNLKPTLDDNYTNDGSGSGTFESELNELETYASYFFRAYATNSIGTGYGENFGFRDSLGIYRSGGTFAVFWSSTGDEREGAWLLGLYAG